MSYDPHIPQTIGEVMDLLASIMLSSPTMEDSDFPGRNLDTEFSALNKGLLRVRRRLGEDRYAEAIALSSRMRAHFAADPSDTNGEAHKGYLLIHEMNALLGQKRAKPKAASTSIRYDALSQLIRDAVPAGTPKALLYAELEPELMPALFYQEGGQIHYAEPNSEVVAELERLQDQFDPNVWAFEFELVGDNFEVSFAPVDRLDGARGEIEREDVVLRKHFGHCNVSWPPPEKRR